jgi:curli biogenesis system outer membrane secretion channel CsgG
MRVRFWRTVALCVLCCICGLVAEAVEKFPAVKLMVLIPEFHVTRPVVDPACETEIIKQFVESGYNVVDQGLYAAQRNSGDVRAILKEPLGDTARAFMAQYGTDILILGEAFSEAAGRNSGAAFSCRARLEVRAISRTDARILAITDAQGSGADTAELVAAKVALRAAARQASPYLLKLIGAATGGPVANPMVEAPAAKGAPTLAVLPFEDKSQWENVDWKLGAQVPDLLNQALSEVVGERYTLVDRASSAQMTAEQERELGGLYESGGRPQELGTLVRADYVLVGRISDFSTRALGLGGIIGGVAGVGMETANVKMLIKMVELKTGKIIKTIEAPGSANSVALIGGYKNVVFGSVEFKKSSVGKALRMAIDAAIDQIPSACPKCQTATKLKMKFCPKCGTLQLPEPPPAKTLVTCPNKKCKTKVESGMKFCPECGEKMPEAK